MMKYQSLNVLSQKKPSEFMTDDAIQEVAMMIHSRNVSESERKKLYRSLNKIENIRRHTQANLDRSSFNEFQSCLDEVMLRFFSVLGIVLKNHYDFEESEEKEDISNMFNILNSYLEEYKELSSKDVAKMCYETTGIELVPTK